MPKKHAARRVVAACLAEPWFMLPEKLEEVAAFLELRAANGGEIDIDQARAAWTHYGPAPASLDSGSDGETDGPRIIDGVGLIGLYGTLAPRMNLFMEFSGGTSTQLFAKEFSALIDNPDVSTVLIEVDSPGGVVTGTEEARAIIFAARKRKRVVAVANGMMASAAYYIGSAATEVVATPSTEVGSIGVYMVTTDATKRADEMGIKYHVFRAGALKASGIQHEALTPERRAAIQARFDGPYRMFLEAVAENRNVSVATVAEEFGQGTVFLAAEAKARGMIDRVATLEETLTAERQRARGKVAIIYPAAEARGVQQNETGAASGATKEAGGAGQEGLSMPPKIKAALFALGLVNAIDSADSICQAALAGFFRGRVPEAEADILKGLSQGLAPAANAEPVAVISVAAVREREINEARAAERDRCRAIRDRAAILAGTGFAVSAEQIAAAENDGLSVAEAVERWTAKPPAKPENPIGRIEAGESEVDKLHAVAAEVLLPRFMPSTRAAAGRERREMSARARQMAHASLMDFVRADLRAAGIDANPYGDPEQQASAWLALGGRYFMPSMDDSVNTAARFPNLLSSLVGKSLDQAIELSDTTYKVWTARMEDLADLKPRLIVAAGGLDKLDELVGDDAKAEQLQLSEDVPGWMKIGRFGNKVGLTPVMVANDDLDAFTQGINSLGDAHERTINHLALGLIAGNVTLLDGYALFDDTNHKNDITAGTAPSSTAATAMKLKHRLQTGIGGVGRVRTPPAIALVPAKHEEAADATFLTLAQLAESKVAATDSNLNTHRGRIKPVVEPDLEDYSADKWYTFADPMRRRVIVHAFQRGYGAGGQRTSWVDPDTGTRYFRLEGRFTAAVAGFRGAVRNSGTGG